MYRTYFNWYVILCEFCELCGLVLVFFSFHVICNKKRKCRNQSIDLRSKSSELFLYDGYISRN